MVLTLVKKGGSRTSSINTCGQLTERKGTKQIQGSNGTRPKTFNMCIWKARAKNRISWSQLLEHQDPSRVLELMVLTTTTMMMTKQLFEYKLNRRKICGWTKKKCRAAVQNLGDEVVNIPDGLENYSRSFLCVRVRLWEWEIEFSVWTGAYIFLRMH